MNDDLNILITFLSTDKSIVKVMLHIQHGLNNGMFENWEWFGEPDVYCQYKELLPAHVVSFMDVILEVENIFHIEY